MTTPYLVAPNGFHSYYAYTQNSSAVPYIVQPGSPPIISPSKGIAYLDNYFFFAGTLNTTGADPYNVIYGTAYSGDPYGPWDTTSYILAQIFPNEIEWLDKHHNFLAVFLEQSIEFFYDAGQGLGSPLARQPIYSKNIGIVVGSPGNPTRVVAKDKDTIYFIGKNANNYMDIYKLEMFFCKPVGTHYIREVLNYYGTSDVNQIAGIELINLDSHTMVMVSFTGVNEALVYFPEEDAWFTITTTDLNAGGTLRSNIHLAYQAGMNSQRPYIACGSPGSSILNFYTTDIEATVNNSCSYYTQIVDMDNAMRKHIAKVYAVGDYGQNAVTLNYSNDQTYTTFQACSTITPAADGYWEPLQWPNVTNFRRGSFRLDITGVGPAKHRALDIVYNQGRT